jgi:hypothetical protein
LRQLEIGFKEIGFEERGLKRLEMAFKVKMA